MTLVHFPVTLDTPEMPFIDVGCQASTIPDSLRNLIVNYSFPSLHPYDVHIVSYDSEK